jgi:hypothetical protein
MEEPEVPPAPAIPAAADAAAVPASAATTPAGPAKPTCVPNIGAEGRKLRYWGGGVALALGLIGAARIVFLRLPAIEMFGPGLAFLAGALGYFQARDRTCVFLAAAGRKEDDAEGPKRFDKGQLALLKAQAIRVTLRAVGSALAVTAVAAALAAWRAR